MFFNPGSRNESTHENIVVHYRCCCRLGFNCLIVANDCIALFRSTVAHITRTFEPIICQCDRYRAEPYFLPYMVRETLTYCKYVECHPRMSSQDRFPSGFHILLYVCNSLSFFYIVDTVDLLRPTTHLGKQPPPPSPDLMDLSLSFSFLFPHI